MDARNPLQAPAINITADMMKNFKTVTCNCGGMLFEQGVVFKKISALVSPAGKEEIHALQVMVCKKCGKVPVELDNQNILPDEVRAKASNITDIKPNSTSGLFRPNWSSPNP